MSKTILRIAALILLILAVAAMEGCQTQIEYGTYARENGFRNEFTITLSEDGSFTYYESMISSHIGMGKYEIDGDVVILTDETIPGYEDTLTCVYKFRYEDGRLIFLADESDKFMYTDLPDGAVFELKNK